MHSHIIFLLDDSKETLETVTEIINIKLPEYKVIAFTDPIALLDHEEVNSVDLFILDINLKKSTLDGCDVARELIANKKNFDATILFITGYSDYNYDSFTDLKCTYDIILKPLLQGVLINRIKVLLKVSCEYKKFLYEKIQIGFSIKDIFDYINNYLIILDENMKIKCCSYFLANDLGYSSEEELIGEDWKQFLYDKDVDKIQLVHSKIITTKNRTDNKYTENVYDIIGKDKNPIKVKWFSLKIENGHKYKLSMGIPLDRDISKDENEDSIRAYWKNIITEDRTTIDAFIDALETT